MYVFFTKYSTLLFIKINHKNVLQVKVYCSILTRAVLRTVLVAQLLHLNVMTAQTQQDRDAFRKKHELLGSEAYRDTHISHTVQAKRVCPNTSVGL